MDFVMCRKTQPRESVTWRSSGLSDLSWILCCSHDREQETSHPDESAAVVDSRRFDCDAWGTFEVRWMILISLCLATAGIWRSWVEPSGHSDDNVQHHQQ